MKRWSRKGTEQAAARMSELRSRKLRLQLSDTITEWAGATGRQPREWVQVVADIPKIVSDATTRARIAALRADIERVAP